ncbi:MAG: hypothetical protein UX91_C0009G0021 [Candidatus Amesbacteria bacterium GW2011_GWB1_47_19]|nr:MAG: hypothetical protein UW51_C0008G0023 [Candidatus Amesbacteria bacterium GW2011_GWA1_44_24]KKU30952.1 MAG: hypothetical protein UX46_C0009G0028 [Candidatus Amesbacteria bacterium GW2011_GWC1_46_24]KKU66615.1 MAG: hypothetical protein UX91_C0009G0021 [Candidatus Amesbacteria bacterium GW2011_GWB1_47_19]OGD05336.1 MAG: hypothetical protein A2379_01270 [Candidatus Amesbacteria bacterium RIFOXYB1_FULL_47_13]HBC73209.1 hypothetical protein [Candidatus Amesbacteria bacterium]
MAIGREDKRITFPEAWLPFVPAVHYFLTADRIGRSMNEAAAEGRLGTIILGSAAFLLESGLIAGSSLLFREEPLLAIAVYTTGKAFMALGIIVLDS